MRKKIPVVIFCICFFGALITSVMLVQEEQPYHEAQQVSKELIRTFTEEVEEGEDAWMDRRISFTSLQNRNEDVIGWITIPGTKIDYAICQRKEDPDYYLHHDVLGNEHSLGAVFADSRLSDDLTDDHVILYGHNMRTGQMFGSLSSYLDQTYFEAHPKVYIYLPERTLGLRVYSAYVCTTTDASYEIGDIRGTTEYDNRLSQTIAASMIRGESLPDKTDRIFTLSTCTDGGDDRLRLVVHCMVTEEKENTI